MRLEGHQLMRIRDAIRRAKYSDTEAAIEHLTEAIEEIVDALATEPQDNVPTKRKGG